MRYIYHECDMSLPFVARLKSVLETDNIKPVELHNPMMLTDMQKAAKRLSEAIKGGENIIIAGDYDMDGVTATSIMKLGIESLGGQADYMIPDRLKDGYGINMRMAEAMTGYDLVVTVDNGIAALEPIDMLSSHTDVIVTDHHMLKERLPEAYAVIDPHRDESYPFPDICGAMVAYKLIHATAELMGKEVNPNLDILAAMGTVADVMPLVDENRTIVKRGLEMMPTSTMPFITAMKFMRQRGEKFPDLSDIRASDVGFQIAPMVNALGRMRGDATPGVRLFTTSNPVEAVELLTAMRGVNEERKKVEKRCSAEALRKVPMEYDISAMEPICVQGDWKKGIVGLIASKVAEAFGVPAFVVGAGGAGSARSVPGVNIMPLLDRAASSMYGYGGHPGAAGFKVRDFDEFRRLIHEAWGNNHIPDGSGAEVSMEVRPSEINLDNIAFIDSLEPFGEGFPAPLFVCRNMKVISIKRIGKNPEGAHLKVNLDGVDGVMFWGGGYADMIHEGDSVDVIFSMSANSFRNELTPQMMIADIMFTPANKDTAHGEDAFNQMMRDIRAMTAEMPVVNLSHSCLEAMYGVNAEDMLRALSEGGYISMIDGDTVTVAVGSPRPHTKITETEAYRRIAG